MIGTTSPELTLRLLTSSDQLCGRARLDVSFFLFFSGTWSVTNLLSPTCPSVDSSLD